MDPVRPSKLPEQTSSSATLASIVESHSTVLAQLNSELNSAFSSVRREINELRNSSLGTTSALSSLSEQLTSMTSVFTENFSRITVEQSNPAPETQSVENNSFDGPLAQPVLEPRLPCPNAFSGDLSLCRGFVSQCELLFRHQYSRYSSPESRVALVVSLLSGRALQWAIAAFNNDATLSSDYSRFISEFKLVFDHPPEGSDTASKLHSISQGSRSVADYAVEFRILAADSKWGDQALISAFRRGLSETIKDLILRDRPNSLSELISLALQVDERLRERRLERSRRSTPHIPPNTSYSRLRHLHHSKTPVLDSPTSPKLVQLPEPEPMQIGRSRLTPEEREFRFKNNLCFYCGKDGHSVRECGARPKDKAH